MVEGRRVSSRFLIEHYDDLANGKVVLFTPGETEATRYTPYLTQNTTTGLFAKATNGAVVLLER